MKEFNLSNPVKNLPDIYKKTPTSNNAKILEIERVTCDTLRNDLSDISDILDINNAEGKTLDLYGDRIGQVRGNTSDSQFLVMIKAKMARNMSNGSFPSVVKSICEAFNCELSEIQVVEGDVPATIQTVSIPISVVNRSGLSSRQVGQIIKTLTPIGVKIDEYLIEGTFCFSNDDNDYDENAGFANDSGTMGGTLGVTESDATDSTLPI